MRAYINWIKMTLLIYVGDQMVYFYAVNLKKDGEDSRKDFNFLNQVQYS